MSCVHSNSTERTSINLVEQVLQQGQRLRNAMVQSILSNDPSYNEFSLKSGIQKMHTINMDEEYEKKQLSTAEKHKFIAYLRGDEMSRNDEKEALETFRAMSNSDICEITERSYSSIQNTCDCDTCKAYYRQNFSHSNIIPPLSLKNSSSRLNITSATNSEKYTDKNHPYYYLKYVDTLKIAVHSLMLNHEGFMKVNSSFVEKNPKYPLNLSTTYFIEYDIPQCILKESSKKSKVDSGLETSNIVKLCSKKLHKEAIYFKQISVHDVTNLQNFNLDLIDIRFQVSCRSLKQKSMNIIGHAKFNMGSFRDTNFLNCNQELIVFLKEDTPITVGTIKINLQLGCGRLYFGKEFLDSISNNKENNIILPETVALDKSTNIGHQESGECYNEISLPKQSDFKSTNKSEKEILVQKIDIKNRSELQRFSKENLIDTKKKKNIIEDASATDTFKNQNKDSLTKKLIENERRRCRNDSNIRENTNDTENIPQQPVAEELILFAFIYISEVEYLEPRQSTYFTCQPFCQNDLIYSNTIKGSAPIFNFYQKIPIIYEEDFVARLRDNFMIFEFLEKREYRDNLIGVCSIPLHQYYLAFRNPVIVKYLERNRFPVIGTDWYEPISDPITGTITGQVQLLVALGSQLQISNLENDRGFKDDIVTRAKKINFHKKPFLPAFEEKIEKVQKNTNWLKEKTIKATTDKNTAKDNILKLKEKEKRDSKLQQLAKSELSIIFIPPEACSTADKCTNKVQTVDKAIQSDIIIMENSSGVSETQSQPSKMDIGTNTDVVPLNNINLKLNENRDNCNKNIRKTTDLLESLNRALKIDLKPSPVDTFKAHIGIDSALHLPTRKKCKAKKIKGKYMKEEIEPSTYVTFEATKDALKVTSVIQKCANPKYDFRCDVELPSELLTNNQKRLIFKVWKKGNNASIQPNMQVDTVLGFAALDLTVLSVGLPTVQGWFNIIDFSNKCNGQIKINVTPLENISKHSTQRRNLNSIVNTTRSPSPPAVNQLVEVSEEPSELFSRALKRKFVELDEITQRLRSRLSGVTNDESDGSNDGIAEEFENDINTLCVEDDYDMVNFVREAQDLNLQRVSNSLFMWQGHTPPDNQTLLVCTNDEESDMENCEKDNDLKQNIALLKTMSNFEGCKRKERLVINTTMQSYVPSTYEAHSTQTDAQIHLNNGNVNYKSHFNNVAVDSGITNIETCSISSFDDHKKHSESISYSDSETTGTNTMTNSASCSKLSESSEVVNTNALDKQLLEGKQRIDTLLQKLSLISEPANSNYNISKRFRNQETDNKSDISKKSTEDDIFEELGFGEAHFDANKLFDTTLLEELKGGLNSSLSASESENSLLNFDQHRPAPDGEGNSSRNMNRSKI